MKTVMEVIKGFETPCSCGRIHKTAIQDVQIGSGLVHNVGDILKKNNFSQNILLVADKNMRPKTFAVKQVDLSIIFS